MPEQPTLISFKPSGHDHQRCVQHALDVAAELCAAREVRLTALRRRVLEMIWGQHEPILAYELLDRLRTERTGVTPPTVYRALDFLLKNGLIHRIESLNAYVGCGGPWVPHTGQFLICSDCNAVAELDDPEIHELVRRKARGVGFNVDRQTIEVSGLCPDCRERT